MLSTSTVVPSRWVITSPIFIAVPDGMLSVHMMCAVTFVGTCRSRSTSIDANTAPPPDMSFFIMACTTSPGLMARPPES